MPISNVGRQIGRNCRSSWLMLNRDQLFQANDSSHPEAGVA